MAMRIAPGGAAVGYNLSYATSTDRMGGVLDWGRKVVVGGYARFKCAGDGRSAVTNTPYTTDTFFTSDSGRGYTTSGVAWNTNTANSWYNPRAWFVIQFLDGSGVPTGLELLYQRGSGTTAANSERHLNVLVAVTGFTGSGTANTPPSGGTQQLLFGTAANGTGSNFFNDSNSGQMIISGTETATYHFWDASAPSEVTSSVLPCGFVMYGSTTTDPGIIMFVEALTNAATADTWPLVVTCALWNSVALETYASSSGIGMMGSASSSVVWGIDAAGAWNRCGAQASTGADGAVRPGPSRGTMNADADGKYPILPLVVEVRTGTVAQYKGICETLGRIAPIDATQDWPLQLEDQNSTYSKVFGQFLVLPWVTGFATATGCASETSTAWRRVLPTVVPDTTAPAISVLPAAGAIPYNQTFTIDATDAGAGVLTYAVDIDYTNIDKHEVVWNGAIDDHYDAASTETSITNGRRLSALRDVGFPDGFTLKVRARDAAGNESTPFTGVYTLSSNNDATAGSYSPANSGTVAHTGTVAWTLTVPRGIKTNGVVVRAAYSGRATETVYAAGALKSPYVTGSSATNSPTTSLAFVIARDNGFPTSGVVFTWECIDNDGVRTTGTVTQTVTGNAASRTALSPASGSAIAYNAEIDVTFTAPQGFKTLLVEADFGTSTEVVYADALVAPYSASSTVNAGVATVREFAINRTPGLPGAVTFRWTLVDNENVKTTSFFNYTISGTNPAAADTTAPTMTVVSPADGHLQSVNTPIVIRFDDNFALRAVAVYASWPSTEIPAELVWISNDQGVKTNYVVTAAVTSSTTLTISRRGGWRLGAPIFKAMVLDTSGNHA